MSRAFSGADIREEFVRFFVDRGHEHVPSAPLIPRDDPTLLFTSSGMVPFKSHYVSEDPPFRRAVSVQRCLRLSDLDEVGRTPYHGTFFEMLGNFSFGDYFKREAIEWGWEFLTEVLELPRERLWITVYRDDDAAADIWANEIGVPSDRIVRLGDEHNFWGPAGDSGPCGPDSEIHYDMGADVGCGRPDCDPGCDCDRFFEIWNLVFPQFLQHPDATREPLARPGIDTGMGFERLCSVVQGVGSLYETDVLKPVVDAVKREVESRGDGLAFEAATPSVWVIVDHARAATFAIAENILPSNEAQGYVVRRLIRRAVRRGLTLGIEDEFLFRIAGTVIETAVAAHPHLTQKREHIALLIKSEEERFHETLASGTAALEDAVRDLKTRGEDTVPGDLAFRLYDTYGFPVDLTREMAAEEGLSVDLAGFEGEMEGQRARGRAAASFGKASGTARAWADAREAGQVQTVFVGYDLAVGDAAAAEGADAAFSAPVTATALRVRAAADPSEAEIVLSPTPFYAESGGQAADTGRVAWGSEGSADVVNVYREDDAAVHVLRSANASYPAPGDALEASVDVARRRRIEKNHTATHLLQAGLRGALGDHVHQSGSWVGPDRLRFDFTHFSELSAEDVQVVEDRVNAWIRADLAVEPCTMPLDEALERGAMALFGERYEADVRAVEIRGGGAISLELCGGTHVRRTGEIGSFAIVSESSVAAGVRRIEAVTGRAAVERARESAARVHEGSRLLRSTPDELVDRLRELSEETARLRKELARERSRAAGESIGSVVAGARNVAGIRVVATRTEAADVQSLRAQADRLREALESGVGVLGADIDGAGVVIAVVTDDLAKAGRVKAGDVARRVAEAMGGRGGGKPHMAQGGGDASRIDDSIEATYRVVEEILGA